MFFFIFNKALLRHAAVHNTQAKLVSYNEVYTKRYRQITVYMARKIQNCLILLTKVCRDSDNKTVLIKLDICLNIIVVLLHVTNQ